MLLRLKDITLVLIVIVFHFFRGMLLPLPILRR